jgi:hypothetical protein
LTEVDAVKKVVTEVEIIVFSDNHNLEDYVIEKQIGQGAYALVFLGTCSRTS